MRFSALAEVITRVKIKKMRVFLFFTVLLFSTAIIAQKEYHKTYYKNKQLKAVFRRLLRNGND